MSRWCKSVGLGGSTKQAGRELREREWESPIYRLERVLGLRVTGVVAWTPWAASEETAPPPALIPTDARALLLRPVAGEQTATTRSELDRVGAGLGELPQFAAAITLLLAGAVLVFVALAARTQAP